MLSLFKHKPRPSGPSSSSERKAGERSSACAGGSAMGRSVTLAAVQMRCGDDRAANVDKAEELVRQAAAVGANIIVLPELFESIYWAQIQNPDYFRWAAPLEGHPLVQRFAALAAELHVVLPVSFFERANNAHFNSVAVLDADGSVLGVYRKSHIADGPGTTEKFFFNPGDSGFRVWDTAFGRLGVAVCWDQWFPEAARALVLQGAEVVVYPTAIGSRPQDPAAKYDHWMRAQQGHAACNIVPVVTANRVGSEEVPGGSPQVYHGGSFVLGAQGQVLAQVGAQPSQLRDGHPAPRPRLEEGYVTASVDLEEAAGQRAAWGVFRDRRPELYGALLTLGGSSA